MPSLAEVQQAFAGALLGPRPPDTADLVVRDGVASEARVAIYRHHVFTSLTAALRSTYPVVCRLVGDGFFGYVTHKFIAAEPPTDPCLFEYGAGFADFLTSFPACRELPYLPHVARLEWTLNQALYAADTVPLDLAALLTLDPQRLEALTVRFDPSVALLSSPWPIDAIWSANQPGADPEATVDASGGGVHLEIRRLGADVVFRRLPPGTYEFRRVLIEGGTLARAADEAATAGDFDVTTALHELFTDNVLTSLGVTSRPEEID
jgi:Putative DNA-binding domain